MAPAKKPPDPVIDGLPDRYRIDGLLGRGRRARNIRLKKLALIPGTFERWQPFLDERARTETDVATLQREAPYDE